MRKKELLIAFSSLIPFINTPWKESLGWSRNVHARVVQEHYFQYFGMILVSAFSGCIWMTFFMALNVVLFINSGENAGFSQLLNVFVGICIFMVSKSFFKKESFFVLKSPIITIGVISLLFMLLQRLGIDPLNVGIESGGEILSGSLREMNGVFGIKMANGFFLSILMVIMSFSSWVYVPLVGLTVFSPKSSSCIMAVMAYASFFSYFKARRFFPIVLGLVLISFFGGAYMDYKTDPKTFISRFPVWHSSVRKAFMYPIGYGPDSYRSLNDKKNFLFKSDGNYDHIISTINGREERLSYYSVTNNREESKRKADALIALGHVPNNELNLWDNPHNLIINIFFQYGIAGIVIFIGFIREIIIRFKKSTKTNEVLCLFGVLMVYFIASMTNFPTDLARTGYLLPIILGAYFARTESWL